MTTKSALFVWGREEDFPSVRVHDVRLADLLVTRGLPTQVTVESDGRQVAFKTIADGEECSDLRRQVISYQCDANHRQQFKNGVKSAACRLRDLALVGEMVGQFTDPDLQAAAETILALHNQIKGRTLSFQNARV